jgi:uncharacterized protein (UPF0305 family)
MAIKSAIIQILKFLEEGYGKRYVVALFKATISQIQQANKIESVAKIHING